MGKTLKIKTFMAVSTAVFSILSIGLLNSESAQAFDAKATPTMLNRTAIAMGNPGNADNIFYDKDTSNDNYVWQNYTDGCYSDIEREYRSSSTEGGGGSYVWVLRSSTKLGDGSCSPEKTTNLSEPKNYDERQWVVFYRDNQDVINSVKADVDNPFIKTPIAARGGASAIYIEKDDMNPYDCPSLIIDQKSPDGWMYVMMRRADNEDDASKQYASLIRELAGQNFFSQSIQDGDFTDDNGICEVVPADSDDEKEDILGYYGLPGSYYNTRANDENREQVDLDYDGANLGGFDLHSMLGMDAAGMALNGPLKGGFVASGELDSGGNEDGGEAEPVCSAGALGWVFCPLTDFMADAIEGIAGFLEGQLAYEALTNSDQGRALRAMWGIILGIANAGLTIAFLMLIFSQATSVGISSYGVKKLLPRVVAAAILMNLSFYICAAAVDIANILGVSIKSISDVGMDAIARNATTNAQSGASFGQYTVTIIAAILAAAIAIGTGAYALLFPVLVGGLLAILTAFLVIAAREVIITILIVLAPLAFLAWVLPNTEGWFTKWRKLFTAMLLMFPLVMAVFYGSLLVSSLILATSSNGTGVGGNINDFMVSLLAFAVLVVPLFSLPFIMKSAGGVLDRLGVMVNNRNKGLIDRSRKAGQEIYGARKNTRRMNAYGEGRTFNPWKANMRRQATRDHRRGLRKGIAEENAQEYIAKKALDGGQGRMSYSGRMVGSSNPSYLAAVQASAQATVDKQDRQSIANREVLIRAKYHPEELLVKAREELEHAATAGKDSTAARAAQNILLNSGSQGLAQLAAGIEKVESGPGFATGVADGLKKDLNSAGVKPKDNALASWAYKSDSLSNLQHNPDTYAGLNPKEMVGQSAPNIKVAVDTGAISPVRAKEILDNPALQGDISAEKRIHLERAAAMSAQQYADAVKAGQKVKQDQAFSTYSGNVTPPPTPPPAGGAGGP